MLLCIWSDKLRQPLIGCGADCGQSQPWLVKARSTNWCETKATPSVSHNSTQLGSDKTDSRRLQDIYDVWGHCRRNYAEWCKHKSEPWQHQFTHQEIPTTPCTHPSTLPVHRPCGLRTNCVPVLLFWRAPWDPATCAPALPSFSISLGSKYIIIGPESDHWLCLSLTNWLTDWLTHSCLVNLIDVTLTCEDANSELVDVVTVADVDAQKRVEDSLLQIWRLKFGHKIKFLSRLWAFIVWSRFWSWSSGEILKLKFSQYFAADPWLRLYKDYSWSGFWSYVWSRFWSLSVVQMLIFGWDFEVAARSRLWIWNMTKIFFENLWYDPKKLLW